MVPAFNVPVPVIVGHCTCVDKGFTTLNKGSFISDPTFLNGSAADFGCILEMNSSLVSKVTISATPAPAPKLLVVSGFTVDWRFIGFIIFSSNFCDVDLNFIRGTAVGISGIASSVVGCVLTLLITIKGSAAFVLSKYEPVEESGRMAGNVNEFWNATTFFESFSDVTSKLEAV